MLGLFFFTIPNPNLETNTPAAPETAYKTASLSKPFIAAILLLMQEGETTLL